MIDIEKQVAYWRRGAEEDASVARELLENRRTRHGLFLYHLALEKALKAHVCKTTVDLAPRLHNLVRLAELAGVEIPETDRDTLADMNEFNIEGRYPDVSSPAPTQEQAQGYATRAAEVLAWLLSRL